jgi:DNA-directed RNA polymerase subunit H (RpoH/RPB5)
MDSAFSHYLVPKIEKLSESDFSSLLEVMHCVKEELPLINLSDPGLIGIDVSPGDVVKIHRDVGGIKDVYYRVVTED